ncbi:hypothetical protein COY15_01670 [Candidatus Roizmanbacteria bacterium CG_4_10_14_0_2_um_filter_39_12]|nr:MAG: hypothetical protein COY15_01670 [Candidatus Roizmanbacteria bacterium CG_4_10_14_0_2_um_filter_39_12]
MPKGAWVTRVTSRGRLLGSQPGRKADMDKEQKILNQAFLASLIFPAITSIAFALRFASPTIVPIIFLMIFVTLGYLTKKGSLKAILLLMIIFVIDRLIFVYNMQYTPTNELVAMFAGPIVISFAIWFAFYRAYLVLSLHKIQNKENTVDTSLMSIFGSMFGSK